MEPKIVALYKVWSGEEWLTSSVESILPFVFKVVILTSNISWIGGKGNPSFPIITNLINKYGNKIDWINHDEPNQLKHCDYGYNHIKTHYPDCNYVQLIDSDEVWDRENYERAIEIIKNNPEQNVFRTQMYTYIKSPLYRVEPIEPLKPVCFISTRLNNMGKHPRGCDLLPCYIMPDVFCHHYVFVRDSFNKVLEKLVQSHVSESQKYQDMSVWIPEVWSKLPNYNRELFPNGFHPAIGFSRNWIDLIEIDESKSPVKGDVLK